MATSAEQILQDVNNRIAGLENSLAATLRNNRALEQQVAQLTATVNSLQNTGPARSSEDTRGGLYDKKLYEPDRLENVKDFKEWSEDFLDFIQMCDREVAALLVAATREKEPISALGGTQSLIDKARPVFRMLKRSIKHQAARQTIVLAPGKNPYEGWRLLHQKYFPQNDASASLMMEKIIEIKHWRCKTVGGFHLPSKDGSACKKSTSSSTRCSPSTTSPGDTS